MSAPAELGKVAARVAGESTEKQAINWGKVVAPVARAARGFAGRPSSGSFGGAMRGGLGAAAARGAAPAAAPKLGLGAKALGAGAAGIGVPAAGWYGTDYARAALSDPAKMRDITQLKYQLGDVEKSITEGRPSPHTQYDEPSLGRRIAHPFTTAKWWDPSLPEYIPPTVSRDVSVGVPEAERLAYGPRGAKTETQKRVETKVESPLSNFQRLQQARERAEPGYAQRQLEESQARLAAATQAREESAERLGASPEGTAAYGQQAPQTREGAEAILRKIFRAPGAPAAAEQGGAAQGEAEEESAPAGGPPIIIRRNTRPEREIQYTPQQLNRAFGR